MHGLKSAILAIFQKGLGWPCPVSADEYLERLECKIRKCKYWEMKIPRTFLTKEVAFKLSMIEKQTTIYHCCVVVLEKAISAVPNSFYLEMVFFFQNCYDLL